ncbi:MAG TPA: hypothetical protein DDW53_15990 [Lachnoclostridium sp.]|nr:hypothetical protein [Lachnoclostridium sp.]
MRPFISQSQKDGIRPILFYRKYDRERGRCIGESFYIRLFHQPPQEAVAKRLKLCNPQFQTFRQYVPYWRTGYGAEQENHGKALCSGDGQDIRGVA